MKAMGMAMGLTRMATGVIWLKSRMLQGREVSHATQDDEKVVAMGFQIVTRSFWDLFQRRVGSSGSGCEKGSMILVNHEEMVARAITSPNESWKPKEKKELVSDRRISMAAMAMLLRRTAGRFSQGMRRVRTAMMQARRQLGARPVERP